MGGLDSEVTDNTKNILLEVARFNPQNVRKSFKKTDFIQVILHTDLKEN